MYDNALGPKHFLMPPLGETLRAARLARGIALSDIAAETRVGVRYLEALETGSHEILPGSLFARNFARQYAEYVGLDRADIEPAIETAFPREIEMPAAEPSSGPQIQVAPLTGGRAWKEANWRRIGWSVLVLFLVLGAGSAIYRVSEALPELVNTARSEAAAARQARVPPGMPTQASAASAESISQSLSQPIDLAVVEESVPAEAAVDAGVANNSISISTDGMAIRLVASEETWVSVTANGKQVFRGILAPNETTTVSGVESARLVVGNAGGLKVVTDGKDIGPIGPPGTVRVVVLSPDGPQIFRQTEETPSVRPSRAAI
jgi:cytoskeleton protein RodZ